MLSFILVIVIMFYLNNYYYLLVSLIMVEFVVVSVIYILYLSIFMYSEDVFLIYYMIFSVCDAVMGLSLVVMIVRYYGNEKVQVMSAVLW